MVPPKQITDDFCFADCLALDRSPTRAFFENLLRGLTHKANNHLAVTQGFSTLILMGDDLDPVLRENVGHIKEAGGNSCHLYERVLLAAGCASVNPQPIALKEFLNLAQSDFVSVCEANGIQFRMNMEPTVPAILADASHFKSILMELVTNAAEAAKGSGGEMALDILGPGQATPEEQQRVDIFVRNTGSEIARENMTQIFEPFYTTKEADHFGVGLAIAGVLGHEMGMKLGVQSANNTTTFWLSTKVAS